MKSLILKDLYNIQHNSKSMLFTMLIFAFIYIRFYGAEVYIVMCTVLCSMMIISTFSFDDIAKWNRYALVTPISRNDLVAGKFIVLIIFAIIGTGFGLTLGIIGELVAGKIILNLDTISDLLLIALTSFAVGVFLGSTSIPFVFKFGAEKGRIMSFISIITIVIAIWGVHKVMDIVQVQVSDQLMLCCSPIIVAIWSFVMYKISCLIFSQQEI